MVLALLSGSVQLQLLKLGNTILVVLLLRQHIRQLLPLELQHSIVDLVREALSVEDLALLGGTIGGLLHLSLRLGDLGVEVNATGNLKEDGGGAGHSEDGTTSWLRVGGGEDGDGVDTLAGEGLDGGDFGGDGGVRGLVATLNEG